MPRHSSRRRCSGCSRCCRPWHNARPTRCASPRCSQPPRCRCSWRGQASGAQKAGHALLQAILVALQLVLAAKALLKLRTAHRSLAVGIVLDFGGLKTLFQRDAHSLGDGGDVANDRHDLSIRRARVSLKAMKLRAAFLTLISITLLPALRAQIPATNGQTEEHVHAPGPAFDQPRAYRERRNNNAVCRRSESDGTEDGYRL